MHHDHPHHARGGRRHGAPSATDTDTGPRDHPRDRLRARLARGGRRGPDPDGRRGDHPDDGSHGGHGGGHRGGPHGGRGMPPFGGGPFGRGRRRDRGDVRIAVLLLLAEAPMHGYGIMREVAVRSGGTWRLSPGAVYPTLGALEAEGLVVTAGDTGRSVYSLTDAGRAAAADLADVSPPWERDHESIHELAHAVEALVAAARQVAEVGDAAQQAAAVTAMVDARRRLYAILATDAGSSDQAAAGLPDQP